MEERNISITLEKAKEWYNSNNESLKEVALQAFTEKELNVFDFTKIKTFQDALDYAYGNNPIEYNNITQTIVKLRGISKASSTMFMLNIVRKILNTGYDLHIDRNAEGQDYTWYPCIRFITKNCTYYKHELKKNLVKKIGKFASEGIIYDVIVCDTNTSGNGLGWYTPYDNLGHADVPVGFLGCATEEIAKHFGKYFGMLIIEAMYGDIVDFKIIK